MRLTEAVYARLAAHSGVVALVGDRVYPDKLPQPPTFPAIAYTRVSQRGRFTDDGPCGPDAARIQIDCYASDRDGSHVLGDAVADALNGWGEGNVQKSERGEEQDLIDPQVGTVNEADAYRVSVDYLVEGSED
jgi:hypothetical protein